MSTLTLSRRSHPRPTTTNRAPHRQLDKHAPKDVLAALISRLEADQDIELGRPFSSMGDARTLNAPGRRYMMGEFGHLHDATDGSFHIMLGGADRQAVIDAGWGEPHPSFGPAVLVYAPLEEGEIDDIMAILHRSRETAH